MARKTRQEELKKLVGRRLREAVDGVEMTQRTFATEIGAAENTFSQWCSGVSLLDVAVAIQIADRFGVPLDFLYRGKFDTMPEELRRKIFHGRGLHDGDPGASQGIYALPPSPRKRARSRKKD